MLIIFERVLADPTEKLKLALNPRHVSSVSPIYKEQTEITLAVGTHKISYAVSEPFDVVIERLNSVLKGEDEHSVCR